MVEELDLKQLEEIRKLGFDPFAHKYEKNEDISKIIEKYSFLQPDEIDDKVKFKIAGRIRSSRGHGKLYFMDLEDFTGKIQLYIDDANLTEKEMKLVSLLHPGDIIGVQGGIMRTKRGELSLLVKEITILTRSLVPLPKEWFGLKDQETRYRKRYLDMLMNPEIRNMIFKKSRFWNSVREFMIKKGFVEVETPVFENKTGGADAKPFITHYNALDINVYLRICAGELWQKRLMVGGFEKTFEIGRVFRNEGIDPEHAQDYTMMEFYWAYADYEMAMQLVEELYKYVAKETFGTLQFKIGDFEIDLGKKWERYDYAEQIKKNTRIDIYNTTLKDIIKRLQELGIEYEKKGFNMERAVDSLWKFCRKKIVGPGFLINEPVITSPLAKRKPSNPNLTERFHPIIAGTELGNGYSELNDPIDQASRFEQQSRLREAGDEEAQMNDKDFVEALEHGMPPTAGFGISERLFSVLMGKSLRECQIFPLLRPEEEHKENIVKVMKKKK